MKRLLLLICILGFAWYIRKPSPTIVNLQHAPINKDLIYLVNEQKFRVIPFTVSNPSTLSLISNFSQKISSPEITQTNRCILLTSGGFYSKEGKPIGLFMTDGKQLNTYQSNALFNGFFSINNNGNVAIGSDVPNAGSRFIIQSGPLLITNGNTRNLFPVFRTSVSFK